MAWTLSQDDVALLAQVGRHNRPFVDLLERLRRDELEYMAKTNVEQFCTSKGRVQVLTELLQQVRL